MKIIEKLLKDLGIKGDLSKQIIEEAKKDDSTFDLTPAVASATEHVRMLLENDSEFVDKFKTAEKGKQLDIFTRDLKKTFGLTSEEIKDKKIDEILDLVKTKTTTNSNKDVQKLQEELITLNNKVKEYEEEIIPNVKKEVEVTRKNIFIENALNKKITARELRVAYDAAYPSLMANLNSQFDLDIDDKQNIHLLQKGSNLKALKQDKSGELTIDEFIDTKFKEWKFIKESNADDGAGAGTGAGKQRVVVDTGNGEEKKGLAGANKAVEALENAKRLKEQSLKD